MVADVELHPTVRFDPDFAARAHAAAARLWRRRSGFESLGRAWIAGSGDDLQGVRAYRAGDDPRAIDWSASARTDAPVVRVLRRARGGAEAIAIDVSRSMAVGPPGKLRRAAEIAAVLALVASRGGARVTVAAPPSDARFVLDAPRSFRALLAWLERLEARGRVAWDATPLERGDRAIWIGDLGDVSPEQLARVAPRGTALRVVQVLAPHEIEPRFDAPVVLVDPETGARAVVDPSAIAAHARARAEHDARLRAGLAARGARIVRASSGEPFEAACARLATP